MVLPCQRKGKKRGQEYLVTENVRQCLEALLKIQRAALPPADLEGPSPLISGQEGARFSVRSYQSRLAYWAEKAGLGLKVSPHWLRHTRGMNVMRRRRSDDPLKVAQLGVSAEHATTVLREMVKGCENPKTLRDFVASIVEKIDIGETEVRVDYHPECLIRSGGAMVHSTAKWLPDLGSNQGPTD